MLQYLSVEWKVNFQSNDPGTSRKPHGKQHVYMSKLPKTLPNTLQQQHTDLTHLYTQRVFGDSSVRTCTHTYLWGGWVGGVGMVTYLGLAYIPNCTHTHIPLGWGGWVGGVGMVTYLRLAHIPNCTHTHIPLGWGGWVGGVGMVTYLGLAYIPNWTHSCKNKLAHTANPCRCHAKKLKQKQHELPCTTEPTTITFNPQYN